MSILRKDRREDTETEEKPLKIKVGIRVMQPQAKRLLEPPEATRSKEGSSPEVFGGAWSCQNFEIELVAPELRE